MSIYRYDYEGKITETHAGAVLSIGQRDTYDTDWYRYAVVWTGEDVESVTYWHSRGEGNTLRSYAVVDATPEVRDAYEACCAAYRAKVAAERAEAERHMVGVGKTVKVVRGRKIPKGTIARVVWYGPNKFGPGERVGLLVDGERVFTDAENVAVA